MLALMASSFRSSAVSSLTELSPSIKMQSVPSRLSCWSRVMSLVLRIITAMNMLSLSAPSRFGTVPRAEAMFDLVGLGRHRDELAREGAPGWAVVVIRAMSPAWREWRICLKIWICATRVEGSATVATTKLSLAASPGPRGHAEHRVRQRAGDVAVASRRGGAGTVGAQQEKRPRVSGTARWT